MRSVLEENHQIMKIRVPRGGTEQGAWKKIGKRQENSSKMRSQELQKRAPGASKERKDGKKTGKNSQEEKNRGKRRQRETKLENTRKR